MSSDSADTTTKPPVIDLDPDQVVETHADTSEAPKVEPEAQTGQAKIAKSVYVAAAALTVGVIGGGLLYRDVLSSYFPSDEVRTMAVRLDALEANGAQLRGQIDSLDKLATQLKTDVDVIETDGNAMSMSLKETAQSLAAATERIVALEENIAAARTLLEELKSGGVASSGASITTGADPARLAELTQRIETLEKDVASLKAPGSDGAAETAALSQALSDLKAKIEAGAAYRAEYDRIARMVPAATGLDVLEAHAGKGLPAAPGLAAELAAIGKGLPLPSTAPVAASEPDMWDRLADFLSGLITIRIAGSADWPEVAMKAAALADSGDLAQAVELVDATEGSKPAAIQQWRDRAQARIALEAALNAISEAVQRVIAARQ